MASQRSSDAAPYLTGPAYGVGLLFAVLPIIDTLSQSWPISLGNPSWRYGTVGIGANYLISFVFGVWLLCWVAASRSQRGLLRILTIVSWVAAALALVATLGFALDALQLRPAVPRDPPRALWVFDVGAEKAVLKYVVSAVVLGWVAAASGRALRAMPGQSGDAPRLVRNSKG
jgi:hypothetical protein